MRLFPSFEQFAEVYAKGLPQVVYTKVIADLETPVSAFLKLHEAGNFGFLLESVHGGEARGRYSVLGFEPDLIFTAHGSNLSVNRCGVISETTGNPLDLLKTLADESALTLSEGLPPMVGGLFGFCGYEIVHFMEELPEMKPRAIDIPDAVFFRPSVMLIFDAVKDEIFIVCPIRPSGLSHEGHQTAAQEAYDNAVDCIASVASRLNKQLMGHKAYDGEASGKVDFTPATTQTQFYEKIDRAKEHIAAGDIFQVVLSQRFVADYYLPPFAFYRSLRHMNPSPFLFFLDMKDFVLAGSSPEILVRLRSGVVTIRPIAGTRKRGANEAEDKALAEDLLADPKELSEHLMLLDLGRNDVGRVAKGGSVKVTEHMKVEYYSHVMHIVSNVEGEMLDDLDAMDALSAGFPAGTVSGAPKIRAMEIINNLEDEAREFYAGCVGYIGRNSSGPVLDTCITLRTALIKNNRIYVQAGAGIVADSVNESEHNECVNKVRALIRAAEEAERFV
jgi:anthranilate synthase component 1